MTKRTVPNDILFAEVAKLLDDGLEVTLRAKGGSMRPNIHESTDCLILVRIDPASYKVGDIVLARTTMQMHVVHRIIAIDGDDITLMGDGNIYGTERCQRADVLAKLMYIERKGRRIDCNTAWFRRKSVFLSKARRLLCKVMRRVRS